MVFLHLITTTAQVHITHTVDRYNIVYIRKAQAPQLFCQTAKKVLAVDILYLLTNDAPADIYSHKYIH